MNDYLLSLFKFVLGINKDRESDKKEKKERKFDIKERISSAEILHCFTSVH